MDKLLLLHGQNLDISDFSRHIEYDFLKEDHKNKTKNLEVIGKKLSKLSKLAKYGLKFYQNFLGIQSVIFSKKTIRTTSKPKIRNIHSDVWKLRPNAFKTVNFNHLSIFPAYTL